MRKIIVSIAAVLFFFDLCHASGTHVILNYHYGNQITSSQIMILSNGLIMSSNKLQGRVNFLEDKQLSDTELNDLQAVIERAAVAYNEEHFSGLGTAMGSSSGYLSVTSKFGSVVILGIYRNQIMSPESKDNVTFNVSQESLELINFANALVVDKIPQVIIASCQKILDKK